MKRLVLLGAGPAHIAVLAAIARRRLPPARVTLIAPAEREVYDEMLPGLIAGRYRRDEVEVDLRQLTRAAGADLVVGTTAEPGYDVLSEAPRMPVDESAVLRAAERAGALAVVVVSGDRRAIELACAVRSRLASAGRDRPDTVTIVGRRPALLDGSPPAAALAERVLGSHRIGVATGTAVHEVRDGSIRLDSGAVMRCDLLLHVMPPGAEDPPPEGAALIRSLAARLAGREARPAPPRRGTLLIDTSDGRAIAAYGGAAFHSRAAFLLRTAMDRAFMRGVTRLTTPPAAKGYRGS